MAVRGAACLNAKQTRMYEYVVSGMRSSIRAISGLVQVVAQGEEGSSPKEIIARQCALMRGVIPMLAPSTSSGAASVDGSMTDWALEQARCPAFV
jgi:hypothetical protein